METGRFAPSPTGRMHLGNVYAALMSWLSVKSKEGQWILRIEDIDEGRSRREYAMLIEDDLRWLGLEWDAWGYDGQMPDHTPCRQSLRHSLYEEALCRLASTRLLYGCGCRRADIMATQAPHQSDGRIVYAGTCRPGVEPPFPVVDADMLLKERKACRIYVPDADIEFEDGLYGIQRVNLARHCGDFVLRRADGAWAYQLAVVVDDAMMGITEVVRGSDLLLSAAQQIYLNRLLGFEPPRYIHIPLLCNSSGQRLSKRDSSLSMEELRRRHTPGKILGSLARLAGIVEDEKDYQASDLLDIIRDGSRDWRASLCRNYKDGGKTPPVQLHIDCCRL